MRNIGVRSGHFLDNVSTGASANNLIEKNINKDVFDGLIKELKSYDFNVIFKHGPLGIDVYNHFNKNLTSNNLLTMCIHHDGREDKNVHGSMAINSNFASSKCDLEAKKLIFDFCENFKSKNRGLYKRKNSEGKDYYGIIRKLYSSVIIGEALVLTNTSNANYIKSNYDDFIENQIQCYVKLACRWYNIDYKPKTKPIINSTLESKIISLESKITSLESKIKKHDEDFKKLFDIQEKLKKIKNIL